MGAIASKGDAAPAPAPAAGPAVGKSGKKICCSCPETKKARRRARAARARDAQPRAPPQPRDECVVLKGEAACAELIEAHKARPPGVRRAPRARRAHRARPRRSGASGSRASGSRAPTRLLGGS